MGKATVASVGSPGKAGERVSTTGVGAAGGGEGTGLRGPGMAFAALARAGFPAARGPGSGAPDVKRNLPLPISIRREGSKVTSMGGGSGGRGTTTVPTVITTARQSRQRWISRETPAGLV
jgi:hypothetical protein